MGGMIFSCAHCVGTKEGEQIIPEEGAAVPRVMTTKADKKKLLKLKELSLYIAEQCRDIARFGNVKLNKILYYADFEAYRVWGEPITGATYQRDTYGPVPLGMRAAREELQRERAAIVLADERRQKRLVPLRPAVTKHFKPEELALVKAVVEEFRHRTAGYLSRESHKRAGWRLAKPGEEIPYYTAFIPDVPLKLTEGELEWARQMARA